MAQLNDLSAPWIATRGCVGAASEHDLQSPCGRRTSTPSLRTLVVIMLLLSSQCSACIPGRGQYKRRSPQKLTPLVYKQYVPNVSEQTLGASGLAEGAVSRDDKKFEQLVPNYSRDILFRDDEGTGADRMMTQRSKEKLDSLAISVMNQWPGVRLRVVEAWDESRLLHGPRSLHYEGRAVDVTTSDRDRSKNGMLARLAVEVGFDWVYYESRSMVHCSVKSESLTSHRYGGCFSADSQVKMADGGSKPMADLRQGDLVTSVTPEGNEVSSHVIMWLDRDPGEQRLFYTLRTASGRSLTLTPGHLIYVLDADTARHSDLSYDLTAARVTFARRAIIGDYLVVPATNGTALRADLITGVDVNMRTGVFAPMTEQGTLVVGGVAVSCYAQVRSHWMAHWAMLPARLVSNSLLTLRHLLHSLALTSPPKPPAAPAAAAAAAAEARAETGTGVHWYAGLLYRLANWLLPSDLIYN